ncbi:hypothetical protein CTAYLR_001590 [Chrysophaeum taylorii]|uniref:Uncharacterized protein n=1 Tax=Chrysophaeum taylorii TaxID=2483200 RepID=A0AAD7XKM3_9STRA|nr:hypothetical protein CTAYLR_001590 [Chrysophaeum taylorii]
MLLRIIIAWSVVVVVVLGFVPQKRNEPPPPRRLFSEPEVLTSDDPLVQRVALEVAEATGGASLDALLNPAKLINVERELVELRGKRGAVRDEALEDLIAKKEAVAYVEKRAVMRDWLKWLFRGQAYATVAVSLLCVYDAVPGLHLDLSIQVLGFWSWWLFVVPSLRSIKPLRANEKRALDTAFYATLVASLAAPVATKDPAAIWWIDAATVGLCYAYGFLAPEPTSKEEDDDTFDAQASFGAGAFGQSLWRAARFATKALDFGTGIERGARSAEKTILERALEDAIEDKAAASSLPDDRNDEEEPAPPPPPEEEANKPE